MAWEVLDARGLRCPMPVLRIAVRAVDMKPGDVLEVWGDCPTLERNVRTWCERLGRLFLSANVNEDNTKIIQIGF